MDVPTMAPKRPSDRQIGDYLDGAATPTERRRIAAEILRSPEASSRLRLFRQQMTELHRIYDGVLDEPLPEALSALLDQARKRPKKG